MWMVPPPPGDRLRWPHGDSGTEVVFQHGSVLSWQGWISHWIWAAPGLQLRGPRGAEVNLLRHFPGWGWGWDKASSVPWYPPTCVDKCKYLVYWGSPGPPPRLRYSQGGPTGLST